MSWLLMLLGCGDKDGTDDSTAVGTEDSEVEGGEDTGKEDTGMEDTGQADPFADAPVITRCDAFCYLHQTGDQFYNWRVECTATDPQGVDNIWNGTVDVAQGAHTVASELVACDASGFCSATFREDRYNVLCKAASSYDFLVKVEDWDGHVSKPYKVSGRQQ